jgi:Phosphatase
VRPAPTLPAAPSPSELRQQLVTSAIAGDVVTPRDNNLRNYGLMAQRDPDYLFGLELRGRWTADDVLALMAEQCGVRADPTYLEGPDTIDPDLTIAALDRMAQRLRKAADEQQRVILATGHPAGLLGVHLEIARALLAAGCPLLTPAAGWSYSPWSEARSRDLRYVGGVAMLHAGGELKHTHMPQPMQAMLGALKSAGEPWPDLVVADHGWAGAAGQAGVDAVGFADSNDPALFAGEAEGLVAVAVPLDDNVAPHLYAPLTAYLLAVAGIS